MIMFIFFIAGVLVSIIGHGLFNIVQLYKFWKSAEIGSFKVLAQANVLYYQSLTVLKLCYEESNKIEDYKVIEKVLTEKHEEAQKQLVSVMKNIIPYEVRYNTPKEALEELNDYLKGR
jgi:hypothetical protein